MGSSTPRKSWLDHFTNWGISISVYTSMKHSTAWQKYISHQQTTHLNSGREYRYSFTFFNLSCLWNEPRLNYMGQGGILSPGSLGSLSVQNVYIQIPSFFSVPTLRYPVRIQILSKPVHIAAIRKEPPEMLHTTHSPYSAMNSMWLLLLST